MKKSLLITSLFTLGALFYLSAAPVLLNAAPASILVASSSICDAPAPDSFRVTARGADFISLAWEPVATGITYYLEVYIRDEPSDPWEQVGVYDQISAPIFTVNGVDFNAECRCELFSRCETGILGLTSASLLDKIILDLVVGGFSPPNPLSLQECVDIPLEDYSWLGFKVNRLDGNSNEQNLFEVKVKPPQGGADLHHIEVWRLYNTNVVATNSDGEYPPPSMRGPNPVPIKTIIPDIELGAIQFALNYEDQKVNLCRSNSPLWSSFYNFTLLGVKSLNTNGNGVGFIIPSQSGKIHFNNPIADHLIIKNNGFLKKGELVEFSIIDLNGTAVNTWIESSAVQYFEFNTSHLRNGIYVMKLKSKDGIQSFKLLKLQF